MCSFPTLGFYRCSETSTIGRCLGNMQTELATDTQFSAYATDHDASYTINNVDYNSFSCILNVENKEIKSVSATARRVENFLVTLTDAASKKLETSLINSFNEPINKFYSDLIIAGQNSTYKNMLENLETCRSRVEAAIKQVEDHQLQNTNS